MCLSAEVRFAASAFLVVGDTAISVVAWSRNRRYIPIALTLVAVVLVDFAFLQFAYISFFCLLAGLAILHFAYIILSNKCSGECPEVFA